MAKRRAKAFTMVELLAATALSAMLMIGVLGVIGVIGERASSPLTLIDQPPDDALLRQLRWDLSHARSICVEGDRLLLRGYGGLADDGRPAHRPADVSYAVALLGQRPWLVRRQSELDALTNLNSRRDLLMADVCAMRILFAAPSAVGGDPPALGPPRTDAPSDRSVLSWTELTPDHGWMATPSRLRVQLWTVTPQDVPWTASDDKPWQTDQPPWLDQVVVIR